MVLEPGLRPKKMENQQPMYDIYERIHEIRDFTPHFQPFFSQQTSAIAHLQGLCWGRRRGRHAERPHVGRHRGDGGNQHGVQDSEGGVG